MGLGIFNKYHVVAIQSPIPKTGETASASQEISTEIIMSDSNNDNGGSNTGFLGHCLRSCFGGTSSSKASQEHDKPNESNTSNASSDQKLTSATAPAQPPVQTPYVPRHAKDSFLKTTSTPEIKKANEIL
ncbi:hypothetical protein F4805DRAFT_455689 [Annulohypoxylon moriforme]|nr:hypothetical protein F4805DRAFT_455689 [Annulohypoxylon moriforme]